MGKSSQFVVLAGVLLPLAGCGATPGEDADASHLELSRDASAEVVPAKLIPLGQVALAPDGSGQDADIDPPYRRPVTETSERLRLMSLEAQRLEANDPENFYVMRIDMQTGDVLAVARSKAAAAARTQQLAPDGEAPASDDADEVVPKSLSDNVDSRVLVNGAAYDSNVAISTTGAFETPGLCSGSLFAGYAVVSAAHCAIKAAGPGMQTIYFAPRQKSTTNRPYGQGSTTYIEYEPAFTSLNCHVNFVWGPCIYHDFVIAGFAPYAFAQNQYNGFSSKADSAFISTRNRTVGYPACFGGDCSSVRPVRDRYCASRFPTLSGGSTSNYWPYNNGNHPMFTSACDQEGGQSGAALLSQDTEFILGVLTQGACSDANCTYSGHGARINSTIFDWMMTFR